MLNRKPPYLGAAYYPEDWDEAEIDRDIEKMQRIGIDTVRIAEFAWHRMEPRPGEFDFSFFHRVVDKMKAAHINVVLGTPTATPPRWLHRLYPDVLREMDAGCRMEHGGRRHCCSNNPHYNFYCMRLVEKMAQEFADDPAVIGWQIDNEIYSFEERGCFCDNCQAAFREYLREKFGTIDALNEAWNLNLFSQWYDDFADIPAPRSSTWHNPHLLEEWNIFQNNSHIDFVHRQADILHRYVRVPVGTDIMPVGAMDYRRLNQKLDVVQFNHYNVPENLHACSFWFDYLRTLKPDQPFWNTETATCWNGSTAISQSIKPEGFCRVNSWLPVALGGEANMYWLWRTHWAGHELMHGSVIDASGRDMHITGEVREVADGYEKAADFLNGTQVKTDVALHFTCRGWTMHAQQKVVEDWEYAPTLRDKWYRPMVDAGLRPDVIDAGQMLDNYWVIFSPMVMTLEDQGLSERLEDWVRQGGVWVAGPLTDVRDQYGARYRDRFFGMIERLTGIRGCYVLPDREGHVKAQWADGTEFTGQTWFEVSDADDQESLARVIACHSAVVGKSVLCKKQVGKGWVILLGTVPSEQDMKKLISLACELGGVKPAQVCGQVMVAPRAGQAGEGMVLLEYGNQPASVTLDAPMVDLLTGQQVQGVVHLQPYQVMVLAG